MTFAALGGDSLAQMALVGEIANIVKLLNVMALVKTLYVTSCS